MVKQSQFNRIVEFGIPILLLWMFFQFYNFGKVTPSEMIKTTGLLAISLLGITLLIGPLSRILPGLNFLKAFRKTWGILSFVAAFMHTLLVYTYFFKFNFLRFIDTSNPKYGGILSGLLALIILLLVTLTSNQKAIDKLSPRIWKIIQTTSYLALILAVLHFYLMEQADGALVIRRLLGQITYVAAILVIILRLLILFLPSKKEASH
ncbi:ferric reductase-like transmembrane domain-containing protein [Candidatus Microgenomates bacterium]|nr:ferric reductase-like transmembrane domain-containing protein [Candidatus Microgenomates bacterium]